MSNGARHASVVNRAGDMPRHVAEIIPAPAKRSLGPVTNWTLLTRDVGVTKTLLPASMSASCVSPERGDIYLTHNSNCWGCRNTKIAFNRSFD